MRRFYSQLKLVVLVLLIVFPLFSVMQLIADVEAEQGSAKVYILQLSGVGVWWVDDSSQVKEGAIEASTPAGKYKNIPRAHPKYGQASPFYSISYQVITGWSAYVNVILNEVGVIVVNTHGEILPVPSGYTKEAWVDTVAEAMTYRRLTWVHMAGYPFYYVWYEGASDKTSWGVDGFKALMSHIGLGNVELWPPESGLDAPLTGEAEQYLQIGGWRNFDNYAYEVDLSRPLKKSDFANCTILPLYRRVHDSEVYWEGAIIAFAKSGARLDPEETEGFGSFVHLGTGQTYDELGNPTNRDYSRGYVATAAAIWVEALGFESYSAFNSNNDPNYPNDISLHVAPVIAGYWWEPGGTFSVRIVLGLYGALKARQGNDAHTINEVGIMLTNTPDDSQMQAKLDISKNGEETGIELEGLWEEDSLKRELGLLTSTVVWLLPAPYGMVASGIILFSKWVFPIDQRLTDVYDGVYAPSSTVHFEYDPIKTYTYEGDYRYEEFQSLIAIDVNVPISGRSDWRVIPVDFWVKLFTLSGWDVEVETGLSIAMWFDPSNNVLVFFEDFEEDMSEWSVGDDDIAAGSDYWGISTVQAHTAWCAQVGDNSITGTPNVEAGQYDNNMNAYLIHDIDLRSYQSAKLSYYVDYWIEAGDYLLVQYYADGSWSWPPSKIYTDGMDTMYETVSVPRNAQRIRFRFISNDDNDVAWGAFIDNVQITAIIPNDAINQNIDAGNDFDSATEIDVSASWNNYAGYLDPEYQDDSQDWYQFYAKYGKNIWVKLHSPLGANFDLEIYSPSNEMKAGSGDDVSVYADVSGDWRIKIYIVSGFGQYSFDIKVYYSDGGGGGGSCPFIYVWNGIQYVIENNILPASEWTDEGDVEDYYQLQQQLIRHKGRHSLLISEFENEHSYIDQIKLLAVDHEFDINVGISPYGEILTCTSPTPLEVATNRDGEDVTDLLNTADQNFYEGYADDYLLVDFGNISVTDNVKLVIRSDLPPEQTPKSPIHIQVLNSSEQWQTVAIIYTRIYWATDIINMTSYLPDAEGEFKVRLYFISNDKVDFVGLDTSKQEDFQTYYGTLVSAIHSTQGNVKSQLLESDDIYVELLPSEQIKLEFTLPENTKNKRTFIFYAEGYYTITQDQ